MKNKKYPHITKRLIFGQSLLMILFVFILIFNYNKIKSIQGLNTKLIEHPFTVSNALKDINISINAMHRTMKDVAFETDSNKLLMEYAIVDSLEALVFKKFEVVTEKYLGNQSDVQNALAKFTEWKSIREEVVSLSINGMHQEAIQITRGKGANHVNEMLNKMDVLLDFANNKAAELNQKSKDEFNKAKRILFSVLIISVFMGIGVSVWIIYMVYSPLQIIIKKIKSTNGHENKPIDSNNKIEILDLAVDELIKNREKLSSALEELQTLNEEYQVANEELEATNEELEATNEEIRVTNEELDRLNRLFVGRELRMKELKDKVKELEIKLNSNNQ